MGNAYWSAAKPAKLSGSQVSAQWYRTGKGHSLKIVNEAFAFYHKAKRNIDKCPSIDHRVKMAVELANAAQTGWRVPGLARLN